MLPAFATPRLRLRPRGPADDADCLAMDREPGLLRYVAGPWADPVSHRAFIAARSVGPFPPGLGYWTVLGERPALQFLGWVLLLPIAGVAGKVEIGWRLRGAAQGRGIATEAAAVVLAHAASVKGIALVSAEIDRRNGASLRVAEKLGMTAQGEIAGPTGPALRYCLAIR